MIAVRSFAFNIWFFGVTAVLLIGSLPCHLFERGGVHVVARMWTAALTWGLRVICGLDYRVVGRVDLLEGPSLIACKHQSAWDTMIFYALCSDPTYVMKKELLSIPLYGWHARKQKMIPVDRKGGGAALKRMLALAVEAIGEGRQIVIFPQGTRTPPRDRSGDWPYHPGIVALYNKLDRPVVPVALNSGLFWGRRTFLKKPGTITVEVLDPIPPGLPRAEFMRELETRIETATHRLEAAQDAL
jgi:1-acyl-sn-glycerol-3-phosphate acyltransferase